MGFTHIFGNVVESDGVSPAVITIENGVITDFRRTPDALSLPGIRHNYAYEKFLIFPGFVDAFACCGGGYATEGIAALNGGITHFFDYSEHVVSHQDYVEKLDATGKCPVDVTPYCFASDKARHIGDIPYVMDANSDYSGISTRIANEFSDRLILFKPEDNLVLAVHKQEKNFEHRHPGIAEDVAVDAVLDICEQTHVNAIVPISTSHNIKRMSNMRGRKVMSAVTPHHLFADFSMITNENRRFWHTLPPLRSPTARNGLLGAVINNQVDLLVSSHSPTNVSDKLRGHFGVPNFDTFGSVVTWLIKSGVDPLTIWRMACKTPGELVKRFANRRVGRIMTGYEASIVVLNLNASPVEGRPIYSSAGWSPFDLRALPGSVQTVFHKGDVMMDGLFRNERPV